MPMTSLSMQAWHGDQHDNLVGTLYLTQCEFPSLKNPGNNSEIIHQGQESKGNDIQLYKVLIVKLSGCKDGKGSSISPERYLSSWN